MRSATSSLLAPSSAFSRSEMRWIFAGSAVALLLFFSDGTPVAAVSAEVYRLIASPVWKAV